MISCPTDCLMSPWSEWGLCDAVCGYGLRNRTSKVSRSNIIWYGCTVTTLRSSFVPLFLMTYGRRRTWLWSAKLYNFYFVNFISCCNQLSKKYKVRLLLMSCQSHCFLPTHFKPKLFIFRYFVWPRSEAGRVQDRLCNTRLAIIRATIFNGWPRPGQNVTLRPLPKNRRH